MSLDVNGATLIPVYTNTVITASSTPDLRSTSPRRDAAKSPATAKVIAQVPPTLLSCSKAHLTLFIAPFLTVTGATHPSLSGPRSSPLPLQAP